MPSKNSKSRRRRKQTGANRTDYNNNRLDEIDEIRAEDEKTLDLIDEIRLEDFQTLDEIDEIRERGNRDAEDRVMNIKFDYVAGFLFDQNLITVALIEKQKPDWQKGKLNAIGGKIESGESANEAMRREFREETGLDIAEWKQFCVLRDESENAWRVHFYYAIGNPNDCQQMEFEKPRVFLSEHLPKKIVIPNLYWLIPMALNFAKGLENCSAFQVVEVSQSLESASAVDFNSSHA